MSGSGPSAVTYLGLPISSGTTHSLGRMSLRKAYQATSHFLATCTELVEPVEQVFRVNEVPELPRQPVLEELLTDRFGAGQLNRFGAGRKVDVSPARVDDALDFLEEVRPQPTKPMGHGPALVHHRRAVPTPRSADRQAAARSGSRTLRGR